MIAATLDAALKAAGLPISGVSVGFRSRDGSDVRPATDKTTWRVNWSAPPTKAQVAAAQAIIAVFDPTNLPPPPKTQVELLEARIAALEARMPR